MLPGDYEKKFNSIWQLETEHPRSGLADAFTTPINASDTTTACAD